MTTAHRPTWKAAVGQGNEGGWSAGGAISHQRSALDAPAHTKLKFRSEVVDRDAQVKESLKAILAVEKASVEERIGKRKIDPAVEERAKQKLLKNTAEIDIQRIKAKYDDSDVENDDYDDDEDSDLDDDHSDDDGSSDDDDSDEDDEAALQAELAKIRAEREAAKQKEEEQAAAESDQAAAVLGNPLLNASSSGKLKRRWNDDVVFRNQAKVASTPKRFINDTVRNDFHRRFLNKFIR